MNTYDMVIIGAGPAGSMAALTASRLGLSALMVERHPVIGSPVRCAEGVDEKGLSRFFTPDPKWIASEVSRYYLVAPDGSQVEIDTGCQRGFILERAIFDRMIAQEAAKLGATVMTDVTADAISEFSDGHRVVTLKNNDRDWNVRAGVVIAADGVESRVARWAGLKTTASLHDMETCAQVTLVNIDVDNDAFYMYFSGEFAPQGYAWVFPKGQRIANVGLGISGTCAKQKSPVDYLEAFMAHYFPDASVVSRTFGGISCSGGIEKAVADGLLVCGDAAHMANPITGGGIINAMVSGQLAAETAAEALKKGNAREQALKIYQKRCRDRFGAMNRKFYLLKEGILNIPDDRLNAIACEILRLPVKKRTPVRVLRSALFNNPGLLTVLGKVIF